MTLARRLAVSVPLVCALWALAPPAEAARVAPAGKLRLHLDTEVLSWTHGRRYYEPGEMPEPLNPRWNVIGFGPGRPVTADGHPLGGSSVIALGVGYGIHRHLILGARFGMNMTRHTDRNDDPMDGRNDRSDIDFVGTFTPYLEILPIPEGTVLPYILVRTGFTGGTVSFYDGPNLNRVGVMAPLVGVGFGAHAFITQFFSVDFGLTFDYRWVHSRGRTETPMGVVPVPWSRDSQAFTLAGTLGISTWF
jgi:hypothetical protein